MARASRRRLASKKVVSGCSFAIDDDIVQNQERKAVCFFQLHRQRGDFPFGLQRLFNVQHFIRISPLVLFYETVKVGAERSANTRRSRASGNAMNLPPYLDAKFITKSEYRNPKQTESRKPKIQIQNVPFRIFCF